MGFRQGIFEYKKQRISFKKSNTSMKKDKATTQDELRKEYKRSDFTAPLARGKYTKRLRDSSNIVVLRPEVAKVFPNEEAVNNALTVLIEVARANTQQTAK